MNYAEISKILAETAFLFPDIASYTYGEYCSYNAYLNGLYWDRRWVLDGADPDLAGRKDYPRLITEEISAELNENGCICRRIRLTIENQDCEGCDLKIDPVSLLGRYVDTLFELKNYTVNGLYYWLTEERAQNLRLQGLTVEPGDDFGIFPIQLTRRETIARPTALKSRMEIILCFNSEVYIDPTVYIPPGLGSNVCTPCPGDDTVYPNPILPPGTGGGLQSRGTYDSDEHAGNDGVPVDGLYDLSPENIYGLPAGTLKLRTSHGTYASDQEAGDNGVPIDGYYDLSSDNIYGLPAGTLKKIT